jgi:4-hydroxy-tetrahydrodipicolinate synthase
MTNKTKYYGIVPPLITTLFEDETFDKESYVKQIEYCIRGGVHGIFAMGSGGEGVHVAREVWRQANKTAIETAGNRVPVYCGAIDCSTARVIENVRYLEDIGAKLAVITPPFYMPGMYQTEILRHFYTIHQKTGIDICIYNMPGLTGGIDIAPETISELAALDRVVAYKDSCPNWDHHMRTLYRLKDKDIAVFVGGEELFAASLLFGSQGNISGLAPSFPKLFVTLFNAAGAGDISRVVELQRQVLRLKEINYTGKSGFSGMKYALAAVKIGTGKVCTPIEPLTDAEKLAIATIAAEFREYLE